MIPFNQELNFDWSSRMLESGTNPVICFDFSNQLEAMKSLLLALFKFTICLTSEFTQNLKSFVVVFHDFPLKVEETSLYTWLMLWRSVTDGRETIENCTYKFQIPLLRLSQRSTSNSSTTKPKEELRLLERVQEKGRVFQVPSS